MVCAGTSAARVGGSYVCCRGDGRARCYLLSSLSEKNLRDGEGFKEGAVSIKALNSVAMISIDLHKNLAAPRGRPVPKGHGSIRRDKTSPSRATCALQSLWFFLDSKHSDTRRTRRLPM